MGLRGDQTQTWLSGGMFPYPVSPHLMYVCMPSILTFHAVIITWRGNDATKILKLKMPWNSSDDYELCFTNSVNRLTSWRWMQAGCEIGWSLLWLTFWFWKLNHFYYDLSKSFFLFLGKQNLKKSNTMIFGALWNMSINRGKGITARSGSTQAVLK